MEPVAFIAGAIRPNLDTLAVLFGSEPLSGVNGAVFEDDVSSFFDYVVV